MFVEGNHAIVQSRRFSIFGAKRKLAQTLERFREIHEEFGNLINSVGQSHNAMI